MTPIKVFSDPFDMNEVDVYGTELSITFPTTRRFVKFMYLERNSDGKTQLCAVFDKNDHVKETYTLCRTFVPENIETKFQFGNKITNNIRRLITGGKHHAMYCVGDSYMLDVSRDPLPDETGETVFGKINSS
jgi:hypothetical protein